MITPSLCKPIILGLPFLCNNNITCNYTVCECNAIVNLSPYNLLKVTHPIAALCTGNTLVAIRDRISTLLLQDKLNNREEQRRQEFAPVFKPLPHVNELPLQPHAHIQLKNPKHNIKLWNYPCPCKWKDAWHKLLQQHLEAGCIWLSLAAARSGAFIIPKADPTALPWWVNDYQQLNANTMISKSSLPTMWEGYGVLEFRGGIRIIVQRGWHD